MSNARAVAEIRTAEHLRAYLNARGERHVRYLHYTNLDGLIGMLASGFFHLSKGDRMNDRQEPQMGDSGLWTDTFIGSFAFGQNENMALWGLYGLPWEEAVCIRIPQGSMLRWIRGVDRCYKVEETKKYVPLEGTLGLGLNDVAYVTEQAERPIRIYHSLKRATWPIEKEPSEWQAATELTGFLKRDAWRYENEVRIRAVCASAKALDRIAIPIPREIIARATVIFGPWARGENIAKMEERIAETFKKKLRSVKSSYAGLVDYRSLCGYCVHGMFVRRENGE